MSCSTEFLSKRNMSLPSGGQNKRCKIFHGRTYNLTRQGVRNSSTLSKVKEAKKINFFVSRNYCNGNNFKGDAENDSSYINRNDSKKTINGMQYESIRGQNTNLQIRANTDERRDFKHDTNTINGRSPNSERDHTEDKEKKKESTLNLHFSPVPRNQNESEASAIDKNLDNERAMINTKIHQQKSGNAKSAASESEESVKDNKIPTAPLPNEENPEGKIDRVHNEVKSESHKEEDMSKQQVDSDNESKENGKGTGKETVEETVEEKETPIVTTSLKYIQNLDLSEYKFEPNEILKYTSFETPVDAVNSIEGVEVEVSRKLDDRRHFDDGTESPKIYTYEEKKIQKKHNSGKSINSGNHKHVLLNPAIRFQPLYASIPRNVKDPETRQTVPLNDPRAHWCCEGRGGFDNTLNVMFKCDENDTLMNYIKESKHAVLQLRLYSFSMETGRLSPEPLDKITLSNDTTPFEKKGEKGAMINGDDRLLSVRCSESDWEFPTVLNTLKLTTKREAIEKSPEEGAFGMKKMADLRDSHTTKVLGHDAEGNKVRKQNNVTSAQNGKSGEETISLNGNEESVAVVDNDDDSDDDFKNTFSHPLLEKYAKPSPDYNPYLNQFAMIRFQIKKSNPSGPEHHFILEMVPCEIRNKTMHPLTCSFRYFTPPIKVLSKINHSSNVPGYLAQKILNRIDEIIFELNRSPALIDFNNSDKEEIAEQLYYIHKIANIDPLDDAAFKKLQEKKRLRKAETVSDDQRYIPQSIMAKIMEFDQLNTSSLQSETSKIKMNDDEKVLKGSEIRNRVHQKSSSSSSRSLSSTERPVKMSDNPLNNDLDLDVKPQKGVKKENHKYGSKLKSNEKKSGSDRSITKSGESSSKKSNAGTVPKGKKSTSNTRKDSLNTSENSFDSPEENEIESNVHYSNAGSTNIGHSVSNSKKNTSVSTKSEQDNEFVEVNESSTGAENEKTEVNADEMQYQFSMPGTSNPFPYQQYYQMPSYSKFQPTFFRPSYSPNLSIPYVYQSLPPNFFSSNTAPVPAPYQTMRPTGTNHIGATGIFQSNGMKKVPANNGNVFQPNPKFGSASDSTIPIQTRTHQNLQLARRSSSKKIPFSASSNGKISKT